MRDLSDWTLVVIIFQRRLSRPRLEPLPFHLQNLKSPISKQNMPTSNNGSTYGHSSHSHGSRTRLNTHGSNSNVTRLDRDRSGSPTEYYKAKQSREDGIGNLVFDMNVFIHKGIEKFLDKQAVRDLLHGYDNDDIYIGGTDIFFAELAEYFGEGEGAVNFSYSERKRLNDIALNLGSSTVQ